MKKLLTILSTAFQLCFAQAQSFNSAIELNMFNNGTFIASMDNAPMTAPSTQVRFEEVVPGNHFLQVNQMVYNYRWHQYIYIPAFSGYVNVPVNTRMNAQITAHHRFEVMSMYANYVAPQPACHPAPVVYHEPVCHYPVMNESEFSAFRDRVAHASFEDTRLSMIRTQMNYTYFNSRQVSELMNAMWFESGRLEVAKMAYNKTVDKQNYYVVNDRFWFDSSVNDLNNYISSL